MLTDERYKQLMEDVGLPNSRSLLQALKQCAMEAALSERAVLAKAMPIPKQESFDGALWSNADQACVDYFSNVQPPKCSDVGMAVWKAGEALSKFISASTGISEPVPAQAAAIPDKIKPATRTLESIGYANGWNDCVDLMLSASPKPE